MEIKKYDIWYVDLNPVKGSEQSGVRPCVVYSNNLLNKIFTICLVIPLTSTLKESSFSVILDNFKSYGLKNKSSLLCFQIRSVSIDRFKEKIGNINDKETKNEIKQKISFSLDIQDEFENIEELE